MTDKPCQEERAVLDAAAREWDLASGASRLPEPEITASGERIIRMTDEQWKAFFEARERRPEAKRKWDEALEAFVECMSAHR